MVALDAVEPTLLQWIEAVVEPELDIREVAGSRVIAYGARHWV
jgi:hypothetical protein